MFHYRCILCCVWECIIFSHFTQWIAIKIKHIDKNMQQIANNTLVCGLESYDSEDHWTHDDVIKWKLFPRYWPFVRGIHRSPVNSPHKGQWCGALMFFICAWLNGWVNNREAGDMRRHRAHYDVTAMSPIRGPVTLVFVIGLNRLFEMSWCSCDVTVITLACSSRALQPMTMTIR